jgi:hypothetical protein
VGAGAGEGRTDGAGGTNRPREDQLAATASMMVWLITTRPTVVRR